MYTDKDRSEDFNYFVDNFDALYKQYGHCFLAIKNKQILGQYGSPKAAIDALTPTHELGTFIIQECSDSIDSYMVYISPYSYMRASA